MTERPTPEQIASTYKGGVKVLRRLGQYGYVIVHPDDVHSGDWIDWPADRNHGWNACRNHIFNREAK